MLVEQVSENEHAKKADSASAFFVRPQALDRPSYLLRVLTAHRPVCCPATC
jgi:hypothetical protein